MIPLAQRALESEIMDDPTIGFDEFRQTLQQISVINRLTGAYRPTIRAIQYFLKRHPPVSEPLKVLDIGSGYGDFARKIDAWSERVGRAVEVTAVDLNPWSEKAAREVTSTTAKIRYITCNAFDLPDQESYHVIINSLFTHHLTDNQIVTVLKWMTRHCLYGWFINDLHRHPIAYQFIKNFVRVFGFNRLVRNDAPLSVARSFCRRDWIEYLRHAQLDADQVQIQWYWGFRYGVLYSKATQ